MALLAQVAPTLDPRYGPGFGQRFRPGPGFRFRHAYYMAGHHGWWWHFLGGLIFVLFLALLIGLVVWVALRLSRRSFGPAAAMAPVGMGAGRDPALEEVRLRYARGEMSREEFVQRSQDLGGTTASGPELSRAEATSPELSPPETSPPETSPPEAG